MFSGGYYLTSYPCCVSEMREHLRCANPRSKFVGPRIGIKRQGWYKLALYYYFMNALHATTYNHDSPLTSAVCFTHSELKNRVCSIPVPRSIKEVIDYTAKEKFGNGMQHDAHECLTHVLDRIDDELKRAPDENDGRLLYCNPAASYVQKLWLFAVSLLCRKLRSELTLLKIVLKILRPSFHLP